MLLDSFNKYLIFSIEIFVNLWYNKQSGLLMMNRKGIIMDLIKFKDFKYERPNLEFIKTEYEKVIDIVSSSDNARKVIDSIDYINKVRSTLETMQTIASVRHSINTIDEFYDKEVEFFDEAGPLIASYRTKLSKAMLECKYYDELVSKYGKYLFDQIRVELETFDPVIIEDMQKENKLVSKYEKLIASSKIPFDGKVLNTSQMSPYLSSVDRNVRKEAEEALWKFFEDNCEEFDNIYDELVKTRDTMAKKLGYENYIELGYKRLGRTDYNHHDVANYRIQIYRDLVPLAEKIINKQGKRIGIDDLKSYDLPLEFLTGNPKPKGDLQFKIDEAKRMYHEMSKETGEFIDFMFDRELVDLEAKEGKMSGGYCTSFCDYKAPFVFSNFNGTSGDVDVLTHEMGHAFQVYCSRNFDVLEYQWPTLEACEIHSMSMEFFAYPWMENFFKEDTDKYKYSHLTGSITFIPYGACVDEFQHEVYKNPNLTPNERKELWRNLEKKYLPYKKYDNEFLNKGNYWLRQSHIFSNAFYYIDYTLAQVCAHQFWYKNKIDSKKAWDDYHHLCKAGGSKPFVQLLEVGDLDNPFVDGTIKKVIGELEKWIDEHDTVS